MSAQGGGILAFLDCVLTEQERALTPLVGLGTCPDWGHCRPECTHQFGINDSEAKLRRCAAERKLMGLHGDRAHSCPAFDYDGDYDGQIRYYDHETCPVIQYLAEGYGWTADERTSAAETPRYQRHRSVRPCYLQQKRERHEAHRYQLKPPGGSLEWFRCPGHSTEGER